MPRFCVVFYARDYVYPEEPRSIRDCSKKTWQRLVNLSSTICTRWLRQFLFIIIFFIKRDTVFFIGKIDRIRTIDVVKY